MNQQYLPWHQVCTVGKGEACGTVGDWEGGGGGEVYPFRHPHDVRLGDHDLLGVPAVR